MIPSTLNGFAWGFLIIGIMFSGIHFFQMPLQATGGIISSFFAWALLMGFSTLIEESKRSREVLEEILKEKL